MMRWPWQKKRLKWIPRPGLLPHPGLVRRYPELAEVEHSAHFRMVTARAGLGWCGHPALHFIFLGPLIIYPWLAKPWLATVFAIPGRDIPDAMFVFPGLLAYVLVTGIVDSLPFSDSWTRANFLPAKSTLLSDYISSGIGPSEIAAGAAPLDFRREKQAALWALTIIGLASPIPSYLLNPTPVTFWTRAVLLGVSLWGLGFRIWPTGVAMGRVLKSARILKAQMDLRRHPVRFIIKNVGPAILILGGISVLGQIAEGILRPLRLDLSPQTIQSLPVVLLPLILLLSLGRARAFLKNENRNRQEAEAIIAEILEWKREELFEKRPPG